MKGREQKMKREKEERRGKRRGKTEGVRGEEGETEIQVKDGRR